MINLTDYISLEKIVKAGDVVLKSSETVSLKSEIMKIQIAALEIQKELLKRPDFKKD